MNEREAIKVMRVFDGAGAARRADNRAMAKRPAKSSKRPAEDTKREDPAPDIAEEELADVVDDAIPTRSYQMLPMVGLGGSAGSIPALQQFFHGMPAESGMVFVVILHLSPEYESSLAELLQRSTTMRVEQVTD